MKKWLVVLLGGLLSLGLVMGGLQSANASTSDDPDSAFNPQGEQVVGNENDSMADGRGVGYLIAHGEGWAGVEGKGRVYAEGHGKLFVKDEAGDARTYVRGFGREVHLSNGWSMYQGVGRARIVGSHVKVVLHGDHLTLGARGKGRFVLHGTGRFEVNGIKGSWPARGGYST